MRPDYSLAFPSVEGILSHSSLMYEGVSRPTEVLRSFDRPGGVLPARGHEFKALERYFYDLYGVFMKKLSAFVLDPSPPEGESIKLQAIMQEMIKVKRLMRSGRD